MTTLRDHAYGLARAYQGGAAGLEPDWMSFDSVESYRRYPIHSAARAYLDRLRLIVEHIETGTLDADEEEIEANPATANIFKKDFYEWAINNGVELPDEFIDIVHGKSPVVVPAAPVRPPTAPVVSRWPWGSHETWRLRLLTEAVERFWKPVSEGGNYDPSDDTTAPTNEQVVAWLEKRGLSRKTSTVIATILRADNLPSGRRSTK